MTDQSNSTTLSGTAASVRDDAAALGSKAADSLAQAADARKGTVAQPLRQVSDAIEAAGEKLTGGETPLPAWVNDSLRSVSTGISDFATRIEQSDSKQLLRDVQDFARQQPAVFLAGCAALGFAAARVLRAGAAPSAGHDDDATGWHEGDVGGFGASGTSSTYGSAPADTAASGLTRDTGGSYAGSTGNTGTTNFAQGGTTTGSTGTTNAGMGAGSGL